MLLGRWASDAVLGYVEEAIAELTFGFLPGGATSSATGSSASNPRRPGALEVGDDWERALPSLSKRMEDLEAELRALREQAPASSAARREAPVSIGSKQAPAAAAPRLLVSTQPGGRVHREATTWRGAPSWAWKTGCGWRFGTSIHYEWVSKSQAASIRRCEAGCVWEDEEEEEDE